MLTMVMMFAFGHLPRISSSDAGPTITRGVIRLDWMNSMAADVTPQRISFPKPRVTKNLPSSSNSRNCGVSTGMALDMALPVRRGVTCGRTYIRPLFVTRCSLAMAPYSYQGCSVRAMRILTLAGSNMATVVLRVLVEVFGSLILVYTKSPENGQSG